MSSFQGKVAVITGGGSGLGRACALRWSSEGASVVVTDINGQRATDVVAQITAAGGKATAMKADVTKEAEMEAAVATAVTTYGKLDIMFANAGIGVPGFGTIALEDITLEQWDQVNDVVYKGAFLAGKHAARQMKKQGGGCIVITTSAGGLNAYPGFGPYCAGKAGAIALVRSMAFDWGAYGIRVNGLAPTHGMAVNFALGTDSPVNGLSYEEAALAENGGAWDAKTMFPGPLKVNRPPSLIDNAGVATFLASDESAYMSGVVIPSCDGGSFSRTSIPFPEDWSLEYQA